MPTRASFFLSSSSASVKEVKKLSRHDVEPLCHLHDNPHPLVDFSRIASCFPCVHLQSLGVGRFDITGCPNLYSIFGWLFWHVLPEAAPTSEWVSGLNSISKRCVHISQTLRKAASLPSRHRGQDSLLSNCSVRLIEKPFVGHCSPENALP